MTLSNEKNSAFILVGVFQNLFLCVFPCLLNQRFPNPGHMKKSNELEMNDKNTCVEGGGIILKIEDPHATIFLLPLVGPIYK